jgi:hypothetical protein
VVAALAAVLLTAAAPAAAKPIAVPANLPIGTGNAGGVHPGSVVRTSVGLCTLNFMFTAPDGARYIGTAGHCILGDNGSGEKTWAPGQGGVAKDIDGHRIGTFVYAVLQDPKDFSLIKLDPSVAASPQMEFFGGPTGLNADLSSGPIGLQWFGNGVLVGDLLPARSALALSTPSPDHVFAIGVATPGDSGSGVESSDGRAIGVLVSIGVSIGSLGTSGVDAGPITMTRIAPQIARASAVLGYPLTLVRAPLLPGRRIAPTTQPQGANGAATGSRTRPVRHVSKRLRLA